MSLISEIEGIRWATYELENCNNRLRECIESTHVNIKFVSRNLIRGANFLAKRVN